MNDEYQWWLAALLASVGATVLWLLYGKLPRREEDVEAEERVAEAYWISERLEEAGEEAPPDVVERVLDLHRAYLVKPPPGAPLRAHAAEPEPAAAPESETGSVRPESVEASVRTEPVLPAPLGAESSEPPAARAERAAGVESEPAHPGAVASEPAQSTPPAPERDEKWAEQADGRKRRPRRGAHRGEQPEPDLPGAA
jgi:hypothetical protein